MTGDEADPKTDQSLLRWSRPPWWQLVRRGAVAFGRFWWDFLVGDTPELLIGGVVVLCVVALLVRALSARPVAVGTLPAMVVALLVASARRARSQCGGDPER